MHVVRDGENQGEERPVVESCTEEVKQPTRAELASFYQEEIKLLSLREEYTRLHWLIMQHQLDQKKAIIEFASISASVMEPKETKES